MTKLSVKLMRLACTRARGQEHEDCPYEARLLTSFVGVLTGAALIFTVLYAALGMPITTVGPLLVLLGSPLTLALYRWHQNAPLAGHMIAAICMAALTIITITTGGQDAAGRMWSVLVPIVATMLAGRRAGLMWLAVAIVFHALLWQRYDHALWASALEISPSFAHVDKFMVPFGLGVVLVGLTHSYERARDQALNKLNSANLALNDANLALNDANHEVEQAHEAARMVLDNIAQGFVLVRADGGLEPARSAQIERWFGEPTQDDTLWRWLGREQAAFGQWLATSWQELFSEWMPLELALSQLPQQLTRGDQHLQIEYRPLLHGDQLSHVLIVMTDISAQIEAKHIEEEQQELLAVFFKFLRDPKGVDEYLSESELLIEQLLSQEGTAAQEKRWLHTLKGNSGLFGLHHFARELHQLEDQLAQQARRCDQAQLQGLERCWAKQRQKLAPLFEQQRESVVTVERRHVEHLIASIESGAYGEYVAKEMKRWTWDSVPNRLDMLAERAHILAQNIGKGQINIVIDSEKLWQPPSDSWRAFWSAAIHVLRNALDHGLEPEQERLDAGKPAQGQLVLHARCEGQRVVIEFSDDGRGIDWGAVERKAKKMGLPYDARQALEAALFADGLSTRDQVSELSGRGVGMQAVKEVCEALGGSIQIESAQGRGTTFRFIIPSAPIQSARTQGADNDDASLDDLLTLSA